MRVWFAGEGLSARTEQGDWVFCESQGAYAAVHVVAGGHHWEDSGSRAKGKWLCCDNEYSPVILEVGRKSDYQSYEEFREKVFSNELSFTDDTLQYTGIYGDSFTFYANYSQVPQINCTPINYAPAQAFDSPFLKSDWDSGVVHIQKGDRSLVLDFN